MAGCAPASYSAKSILPSIPAGFAACRQRNALQHACFLPPRLHRGRFLSAGPKSGLKCGVLTLRDKLPAADGRKKGPFSGILAGVKEA